jgi:hypothetical protein
VRQHSKHFQSGNIVLLLGTERNIPCFHYLQVTPQKKHLLRVLSDEQVDLEAYGTVIASGFGFPDAGLRAQIEQEQGFKHDPKMFLEG